MKSASLGRGLEEVSGVVSTGRREAEGVDAELTFSTHCYSIADTNSVILPAYHAGLLDGGLDVLTKCKQMIITRVPFPPDRRNADVRVVLHRAFVFDAGGVEHGFC